MKNDPASPFPVRHAEIVEVLKTVSVYGKGIEDNPIREITQYWTLEGKMLLKIDPWVEDLKRHEDSA